MAKKKKASSKKKRVFINDFVATWRVEVAYKVTRNGETVWHTDGPNEAYDKAYKAAKQERESRRLPQGSMKVIFPESIK